MESQILAAVSQSREAFDNVLVLDVDEDFSDKAKIVWKLIKEYYGQDENAYSIDTTILKSQLKRQYPKHAEQLSNFLDDCGDDEVSVANLVKEVYEVKLDHMTDRIASCMVAKQYEEADKLLEVYRRLRDDEVVASHEAAKVIQGISAAELMARTQQDNLIKVLPTSLNRAILGGVLPAHHIVVFASTDLGKTLFAVNMSYGFLKQGLKVLYIGNEDPGEDIITRLLTRMTGMEVDEIRRNPSKADE